MTYPIEKTLSQKLWDLVFAPARLTFFSDEMCQKLRMTSINDERLSFSSRFVQGRLLDIGCGKNKLVNNYQGVGTGVDVFDWKTGATIVPDTSKLPYESNSFDTVTILAALNHIPNRDEVLQEAYRLTSPSGRLVLTMINPVLSVVGHRVLWWYGEDWARGMEEGEVYGFWNSALVAMVEKQGFVFSEHRRFLYGLNNLFVFTKPLDIR